MIKVFLNRKLTIKEFVELYTLRKNTEISFIPFQGRIQRSAAITYPFEEQPDSTRQIHGRSR